ncbi:hypothetical protein FB451DRAFT_1259333 [Mycena latifolia]|nr:hypothetical protein FB451DRAFT_1259333 [Mycena latifolia]
MKLSIVPIVVASAGLLASASPMRVVVVSSSEPMRVPMAPPVDPHAGPILNVVPHAKPCGGARLRQKAISFASAFRLALGFGSDSDKEKEAFKTLPFLTPGPVRVEDAKAFDDRIRFEMANMRDGKTAGGDRLRIVNLHPARPQDGPVRVHHHHAHGRFHHKERSFLMRVHFALMSLGPWEGRAVAFVLGCGIGVLLRMFFVLTVLAVRVLRGSNSSWTTYPGAGEHEYLIVGEDAEEIFVAPPVYTTGYPVEKAEAEAPVEAK